MMLHQVLSEIQQLGHAARDQGLTGWNCWPKKQKLYEILWAVEKELARCPTFSVEDEWLEEHAKDQMLEKLKGN
jgi:hypothetical protein